MEYLQKLLNFFEKSGFKLVAAILIVVLGMSIIRDASKLIRRGLLRGHVDSTFIGLISGMIKLGLYLALALYALSIIGVPLTGFVAALSALTLAIGLSLQSIISSVANSIMLVALKPFKVGDCVQIGSITGNVIEINFIHTVLDTLDNVRVVIPNSSVFSSQITNYSTNDIRRVVVKISVDYDEDTDKAREVLLEAVNNHPKTLSVPAPTVRWNAENDSYLEFVIKAWCLKDDYWATFFDLSELACRTLQINNINIPFPQLTLSYRDGAKVEVEKINSNKDVNNSNTENNQVAGQAEIISEKPLKHSKFAKVIKEAK